VWFGFGHYELQFCIHNISMESLIMDLKNKTILLTGASTGIGKAIAENLINFECNLILIARRTELINKYLSKHEMAATKPLIIKCDVSKKDEIAEAHKMIKEKFEKIDLAILNAGIGHEMKVERYNSGFAEEIFGANIFGMIYWIEQLLPDFLKQRNGIIAGVSSLADNRGYSGSGFYCASKAAVSTYLEGLSIELKKHGIKVITVRPGFVKTPMTDKNKFKMPFLMAPEKAAQIILDGIEKEKRIIQFPWPMVLLTRIVGLLPGSFYEWAAGKVKS
jgi:short-subunit dehydrogenase